MGVLIDASVLIEHERKQLNLTERLHGREDEEFFLSVITVSELLHGVHRSVDPGIRARRSAWVEAIIDGFPLLPIDAAIARSHAHLWAEVVSRGTPVGAHDLWLAASCIAHGLRIVTSNVREFSRVPGLDVESW